MRQKVAGPPTTAGREGRRESFSAFALSTLFDEGAPAPPAAEQKQAATKRLRQSSSGSWGRHIHGILQLGYAMQQSFVVVMFAMALSGLRWHTFEAGVPLLDKRVMLNSIWMPMLIFWFVATWAYNVQLTQGRTGGPKYARWTLLIGCVVSPVAYVVFAEVLFSGGDLDLKWLGLDIVLMASIFVSIVIVDTFGRKMWVDRDCKQRAACVAEGPGQSYDPARSSTSQHDSSATAPQASSLAIRGRARAAGSRSHKEGSSAAKVMASLIATLTAVAIGFMCKYARSNTREQRLQLFSSRPHY